MRAIRCSTSAVATRGFHADVVLGWVRPVLTPTRRRGVELLDDPSIDPALASRSLEDIERSNRWFGGRRAVMRELDAVFAAAPAGGHLVLLDVGTGLGDIPRAAHVLAAHRGMSLSSIGLELTPTLARGARQGAQHAICGNALSLPLATNSVDVVSCSQVLHHFEPDEANTLLREMARVARCAVIVSDLRRSWTAAALLWLVSFPLGFHPVSRHDGIASILRGYTAPELEAVVRGALGGTPAVQHRAGWRITALWSAR